MFFGLFESEPEIDVDLRLEDLGLFRQRRGKEPSSQRERAEMWREKFGECMRNALALQHCVMPQLCAHDEPLLSCAHLHVDYANLASGGIPLPHDRRRVIDARLRAIGTLVYRREYRITSPMGALPGDRYVPELAKIARFTGKPKAAPEAKDGGFLDWLFG